MPVLGFGQTEKGKWKLSGDTNISLMSLNGKLTTNYGLGDVESSSTSFTIEPSANYFVADNIVCHRIPQNIIFVPITLTQVL